MPAESGKKVDVHASQIHAGFPRGEEDYEASREKRADLVRQFLAVMDEAGRPGQKRKLGSTVLQITGQRTEHYWATILEDDAGYQREVLVFDDGTHGWSDEITYSDRPRTPADEISPGHLKEALTGILEDNDLSWPDGSSSS